MGVLIQVENSGKSVALSGNTKLNSLVAITHDHATNHLGGLFAAYYEATLTTGATFLFSFKTPLAKDGYVHYRRAFINPSKDLVRTEIWEGATINVAGTTVLPSCTNRAHPTILPAELELRRGTTFSANGTKLEAFSNFLPGSEGRGQTRIPQSASAAEDEIILAADTVYRFVLTNGSTATNIIAISFKFYIGKED